MRLWDESSLSKIALPLETIQNEALPVGNGAYRPLCARGVDTCSWIARVQIGRRL